MTKTKALIKSLGRGLKKSLGHGVGLEKKVLFTSLVVPCSINQWLVFLVDLFCLLHYP